MKIRTICSTGLRAGLAFAAVAFVPALVAESPVATPATTPSIFTFNNNVTAPTRDFRYQPEGMTSSSSDDAIAAGDPSASLAAERDSLSFDGAQPPPGRRSYGRSRYQDRWHNSDGSTKIALMAGAGLNVPNGNTAKFYTPSYTIAAGAGFNFNRMFGVLGEFHYDHMGLTGGAIQNEYNNVLAYLSANAGATPSDLAGFDANAHVVSFTVDPIVNFSDRSKKLGAYVTGGLGWYRKTTNFTLPTVSTACGTFFCQQYASTYNIDQASADTFGYNIGFGLSYAISQFSSERLFVDARYHWLPISSNNNQDFFPFNRRNTSFIPITVGIRF